ncbi:uncharacterized protein [Lepeophtheirus salmonis]|uniref:Uncharacterized protein n=1 Tax=Lepeophtheirus salmonis TaxID=72036 RepID=A0A0K2TJZ8_LEPSM|nr:uncharacterized protein LOC121120016 [Lepeophtheirus salmonis]
MKNRAMSSSILQMFLFWIAVSSSFGDIIGGGRHRHSHNSHRTLRKGRQNGGRGSASQGLAIDFTGCVNDPSTGFCCIEKEEPFTSLQKDPILECTHKNVEKCHYTYVTQFTPSQEEVCEENFEKTCQVTFKQQAFNDTIRKCYKPLEKICNGQGPEECKTVYESSCTTKYVEKKPGKYVGDTKCEKLPIEICGAGCVTSEGPEECHNKVITSLIDVPEEVCDLNPQKTCRFQTKLVPKLSPKHECTVFPQEICHLKFSQAAPVTKTLRTKWCQDPTPPSPGESYEENENTPPLITTIDGAENNVNTVELPTYVTEPPPTPPPALYGAPPRSPRQQFSLGDIGLLPPPPSSSKSRFVRSSITA